MTLMVHEFVGAAFSGLGLNPVETFGLGLASHYVLDAIPHWDYLKTSLIDEVETDANGKVIFKAFRKDEKGVFRSIMFDVFGGLVLSLLVFRPQSFYALVNLGAGLFGAFLPDFLGGLSFLAPQNKFLKYHYKFHNFIHTKVRLDNHPYIGATVQLAMLVLVVLLYRGAIKL